MTAVVYAKQFGAPSEVWLYRQVTALGVPIVTHEYLDPVTFPYDRVHVIPRRRNLFDKAWGFARLMNEQHDYFLPFSTERSVRDTFCDLGTSVLHAHFGDSGIRLVPLARRLHCRLVVTFHGFDASRLPLADPRYRRGLEFLWRQVNTVIAVSEAILDKLVGLGCPEARVEVVPLGVPLGPMAPRKVVPNKRVRAVTVARLVGKKGVPDLVDAVKQARVAGAPLELDILGDGPERAIVEERIEDAGLMDAVRLHGSVPPQVVARYLAEADLFVLNSRTGDDGDAEGLPISILEAMAAGLCVVSTRHSGIPEAVKDRVTGRLVAERDTKALGEVLAQLCRDPAGLVASGAAGRVKVEKDYDAAKSVARLREIYAG